VFYSSDNRSKNIFTFNNSQNNKTFKKELYNEKQGNFNILKYVSMNTQK